jgi:hypothetical protein
VGILGQRGDPAALAQWTEEAPGGRWRLYRVFRNAD